MLFLFHLLTWEDFLQWLLDKYTDANMDDLVQRVQFFNFASIHTTSLVHFFVLLKLTKNFASAMYYLAIYREYAEPIRKEIETIVASDGWTKAGLMKMHKLDSFLKESMRLSPLGAGEFLSILFFFFAYILSRHYTGRHERLHFLKWHHHPQGNKNLFPGIADS